jgi:hypothetical protein
MSRLEARREVLRSYGADGQTTDELLAYNANAFKLPEPDFVWEFPLSDEDFVATWVAYAAEAGADKTFEVLQSRLVQLSFPILHGMSQCEPYIGVTRRGWAVENMAEATGLSLQRPDAVQLSIHQTAAGKIPVVTVPEREDFVSVVRALTSRNEPEPIPDSMGACIVSGYNNWDRVRAYRSAWAATLGIAATDAAWAAEFRSLITRKSLYQDRFILLSAGFYSAVTPEDLGLSAAAWQAQSQVIRREHECTHYFTRRVFQSMRNLVLDELIADYAGLVAATGRFRADWFLRFMGLERLPLFRAGGRLNQYRGSPPLSERAFQVLQRLLVKAAETLEDFSADFVQAAGGPAHPLVLTILSLQTLEELAAPDSSRVLSRLAQELLGPKTVTSS